MAKEDLPILLQELPPIEHAELGDLVQFTMDAQYQAIKHIQSMMQANPTDPLLRTQLDRATKAVSSLVKEARALAKDVSDRAEELTDDERRKVMVEWFHTLPAEHQRQLLEELQGSE